LGVSRPGADGDAERGEGLAAAVAEEVVVGLSAAAVVHDHAGDPGGLGIIGVAPEQQVGDDRPQLAAFGGGAVLEARGALLITAVVTTATG
jgi:hypothetical protein